MKIGEREEEMDFFFFLLYDYDILHVLVRSEIMKDYLVKALGL